MIFPAGRESLIGRFPLATLLLGCVCLVVFLGTWPKESEFVAARDAVSPLVVQSRKLAALALEGDSTLPSDLRVRLEDLRSHPHFPNEEADRILQEVEKNFAYLNTLKRPDWNALYQTYRQVRDSLVSRNVPWRSVMAKFVVDERNRSKKFLFSYMWVHVGIVHLLVMLYFLWLAGSQMEDVWGFFGTVFLFVTGGVFSAWIVRLLFPGGAWILAGASGAVAALLGAMVVRRWGDPLRFFFVLGVAYGVFTLPTWTALLFWVPVEARIGWLTRGSLDGLASHALHGAGFLWGLAAGGVIGYLRKTGGTTVADDSPAYLGRLVDKAKAAAKEGKMEEVERLCQSVLEADQNHLGALWEVMGAHEFFQREEEASRTAVRIIRVAIEQGRGQLAEEVFRRWSLRLFQVRLPPQERLGLAQNLEQLQLWREALAYYLSVIEQSEGSPFAGKAIFAAAKINREQMRKTDEAARLLRRLLDPPYDLEWRPLAEAELRSLMQM